MQRRPDPSTLHPSTLHPSTLQPSTLHRGVSPVSAPLRLNTPPPRFQHADSSSSCSASGRLPSRSEDVVFPNGERSAESSCDAADGDDDDNDVGAEQGDIPEAATIEETPLPQVTTPPHGRRDHSSSRVGPRGSLSTRTRTSPRKNIWTSLGTKQRKGKVSLSSGTLSTHRENMGSGEANVWINIRSGFEILSIAVISVKFLLYFSESTKGSHLRDPFLSLVTSIHAGQCQ